MTDSQCALISVHLNIAGQNGGLGRVCLGPRTDTSGRSAVRRKWG